ncbi:MAG: hypothetical protein COZ46_05775 [Verrucomicrobia bacterium CG_4_10_14_3_um_filter_43_23]|nr:MAG: hypothetical protein AUJ82_04055 [Verrucomicrobia bacterium CG1_02_43_26]PIP58682.1 MAG: hypothetical protein COX01_07555 [Verrucomicrobia bacterium CG22_combo_CG10-13_8_21_14_all_43_17]PIX58083.1 MAG: hypothetical protein COZ46_05775 [Verrucomicrobia bacterium CG_4_10_14_3_um_filter_43_23]PIY61178.1 MAG: hypothetical protein COY94_06730 [Verrucomicrobia bacterium CG_4_10_14_0_8_um_filter_43_34]PJA43351.1 MAG: hypothetical protein CO175_08620 [Verrucomicrobia bacterium CG_4_9_14_3_um_fi
MLTKDKSFINNKSLQRPKAAKEVSLWSESEKDFGYNFQDWVHELRRLSSKPELLQHIQDPPPRLANLFPEGNICDAYLAAYAAHLCRINSLTPPEWTQSDDLVLEEPWFSNPFKDARFLLLRDTPPEFKNKNLFTTPEITFKAHPGRPKASIVHKRKMAALRQKAYRKRIADELKALRKKTS